MALRDARRRAERASSTISARTSCTSVPNDGALYKVRAADGGLLWRFNTAAEVARRPVLDGTTLYVVNANDTLISIDASSGKLKWHQHRTPAFGMEVAGYAGAALGQDKVFTAFSDGVVMAYSQSDGAELWPSVDLAAEAEQSNGGEVLKYLDLRIRRLIFDTIKAGPDRCSSRATARACSRSTPRTARARVAQRQGHRRHRDDPVAAGCAPRA